ncbi:MAG: prephenate dehydrogenase/arogenate dehydrogenase family protein [Fuerstiella sp.]
MEDTNSHFEDRVVIVGVGLIGGSVAAAVRQRYPDCDVVGVGRSEQRLAQAGAAGLLTEWHTKLTPEIFCQKSSVVVICLPVHLIAEQVLQIAGMASAETLITDAGSVKGTICRDVSRDATAEHLFVGAHPIAGGEQGGFEYAEAGLFTGKVCVVMESSDPERTHRARKFWGGIGCQIITMTADDHDQKLALTSHLPHIMAAVTTAVVGEDNLSLTGSGFRDATRIAAGDAALWKAILAGNRIEVVRAIAQAEGILGKYRAALQSADDAEVERLLQQAAACRSQLDC